MLIGFLCSVNTSIKRRVLFGVPVVWEPAVPARFFTHFVCELPKEVWRDKGRSPVDSRLEWNFLVACLHAGEIASVR